VAWPLAVRAQQRPAAVALTGGSTMSAPMSARGGKAEMLPNGTNSTLLTRTGHGRIDLLNWNIGGDLIPP
jgi:hypothetical protein